jgi:predicted Zn-ribbon and HTH transcriptional regulator
MYRKAYLEILRDRPASLSQLATLLGTGVRDVEQDLEHLRRSLRNTRCRAVVQPARCRRCGFLFRRDRLHKPGRCPVCRGAWISEPRISIEERP